MFILRRGGVEKYKNVVQASVFAPRLFDAVPEQLDTKRPFIVRYIHQSGHEFERFKFSDVLDKQIDSALGLVPEKDVGVFINNFSYFVVLHIFKVVQSFFVVFF